MSIGARGLLATLTTLSALAATGCSALAPGLSADSTCEQFNTAPVAEQRQLIAELVQVANGGLSNPLREANAVMQITYTCQSPGQGSHRVGDIAI
jgi:hypothetical protein